MSSMQQAHYNQTFDVVDPVFYSQQHQHQHQHQPQQQHVQQYMTLQQLELERIRQVQQQAAIQQQRALEMMYYQQEMQHQSPQNHQMDPLLLSNEHLNEFMTTQMGHFSPSSSASPPSHSMSHFPNQQDGASNASGSNKAQKRAEHNAIERARRECLNTKFQQLAHSLPNLQNDRRPSKGTIIERTLEYVKQTVQKEERFQSEIDQLRQANENLIYKMTSDHFGADSTIEEADEELEYEDSNTPDCDDNFSSRSSVTSVSSHHMYSFTEQQQPQNAFEKAGDTSFINGGSPALLL
ncbi:hypothetical protein PS15m_002196 [Mucor circinelloides]